MSLTHWLMSKLIYSYEIKITLIIIRRRRSWRWPRRRRRRKGGRIRRMVECGGGGLYGWGRLVEAKLENAWEASAMEDQGDNSTRIRAINNDFEIIFEVAEKASLLSLLYTHSQVTGMMTHYYPIAILIHLMWILQSTNL